MPTLEDRCLWSPILYVFLLMMVRATRRVPTDPGGTIMRKHNRTMSLVVSPIALIAVVGAWWRLCKLTAKSPLEAYFAGVGDFIEDDLIMRGCLLLLLSTKYMEWIDTILIISRGRPLQILHVWHHATIVVIFYTGFQTGSWAFVGIWNSLIHIVMYAYYAKISLFSSYARYITLAQISHLSVGLALALYTLRYPCCRRDSNGFYSGITASLLASYILLFARLYKSKYD